MGELVSHHLRHPSTTSPCIQLDTVYDPACGCGNFLIIAYRELRALELRIHQRLQELYPERRQLSLDAASLVHVKLSQFHGIEIEEWPATIAKTAMFFVEHQANQALSLALGYAYPMLPLQDSAQITVGKALRLDWRGLVHAGPDTLIVGNPPFIGHQAKAKEQRQELKDVWGELHDGTLDYVTAWFKKASDFFRPVTGGRFAFVSTNSIAQGQGVAPLFGPLFDAGWRIRFAHQTFSWTSEAPGAAAVHCVITGYDKHERSAPQLFTYNEVKGEPTQVPAKGVNAYLIDGPNLLVRKRTKALSPMLSRVSFGTMPADGGNLIVEADEYSEIAADPIAARYLRPFRMGREVVRGLDRWCLWMADSNFDPSDLGRSPVLKARVEACRAWRSQQSTGGDAYKLRDTPHVFRGNKHRPLVPYVGIPRVVSETRAFYTVQHLPETVIAGDQLFTAEDPDGFLFGVISSSMFITWQRAVGGALESRLRFSNTIVWNNLPLPAVEQELREKIIEAGKGVIAARELHPERSLAEHYNPLAMSPALLKAHAALDRVVDKAFGAKKPLHSNEERLTILFERYADMTA
ncbi:DNA methyltransferase [Dermabacter jinjuensis]|uniref:DNA methyltransferase n=1 Tax=Dermabacter TaxID=36739 RepID=UPI002F96262B